MDQEKIGKLIAKLRKSKGLTQRELGEMVGVGFRAVSKWETGLTSPDISIINDLSKILGISADELLKGEVNKTLHQKQKFNYKNLLYIIPIFLVLILSIILIIINNNKTEVYKLEPVNASDYYIEGEAIFKGKNMSLNISKLVFHDIDFNNTIIKNYQYELYSNNTMIVGYGYMPIESSLTASTSINEWSSTFKINYDGIPLIKKDIIVKSGINLKIAFINDNNIETTKDIRILLLKEIKEKIS